MQRALPACRAVLPCAAAILLIAGARSGEAQTPTEADHGPPLPPAGTGTEYRHSGAPRARAVRVNGGIALDGVLEEAAWSAAPPIEDFIQTLPLEGDPASERTEVRIVYDDNAVYVGAHLADRSTVTTRLARRDAGLEDSDVLVVLFDSFHDHETAYRFWTNPSGVKGDAIVTGNGTGRGDTSWDPVWEVATQVTAEGWTAEMRIPFSQLRFSPDRSQVWGVQIERNINRLQENATFPFTPLLERAGVSRFAHLDGIAGIEPGRRLELLPYAVARGEYVQLEAPSGVDFRNPYRTGSDYAGSMGLDLKYRLSSNLTLDGTINPDFGQVELDPSVINLTAFETRYAERRPFFVEGADIFGFGEAGPMGSVGRGPEVFYSRRIGRPPRGAVPSGAAFADVPSATTIAGAAKITGRFGSGWSLGILEAVTARETAAYVDAGRSGHELTVEPAANYFVGRLRRQIRGGQTRFGAIGTAVNRDASGRALLGRLHSSAYAGGIDFAHESTDRVWLFTGALSGSRVHGTPAAILRTQRASTRYYHRPDATHLTLDPGATSLSGLYAMGYIGKQAGTFTMRNGFAYISPGYEANDIGFHTNADRILFDTHYQYNQLEPGRWLRSWRFFGGPDAVWNTAGDMMFMNVNVQTSVEFLNYWTTTVRLQYNPWTEDDRLTRGGPIARSPSQLSGRLNLNSDSRRPLIARANYSWGSDARGGWNRQVQLTLGGRFDEILQVNLGPRYSWSHSTAPVRDGCRRDGTLSNPVRLRGDRPVHALPRDAGQCDLHPGSLPPALHRALHRHRRLRGTKGVSGAGHIRVPRVRCRPGHGIAGRDRRIRGGPRRVRSRSRLHGVRSRLQLSKPARQCRPALGMEAGIHALLRLAAATHQFPHGPRSRQRPAVGGAFRLRARCGRHIRGGSGQHLHGEAELLAEPVRSAAASCESRPRGRDPRRTG